MRSFWFSFVRAVKITFITTIALAWIMFPIQVIFEFWRVGWAYEPVFTVVLLMAALTGWLYHLRRIIRDLLILL